MRVFRSDPYCPRVPTWRSFAAYYRLTAPGGHLCTGGCRKIQRLENLVGLKKSPLHQRSSEHVQLLSPLCGADLARQAGFRSATTSWRAHSRLGQLSQAVLGNPVGTWLTDSSFMLQLARPSRGSLGHVVSVPRQQRPRSPGDIPLVVRAHARLHSSSVFSSIVPVMRRIGYQNLVCDTERSNGVSALVSGGGNPRARYQCESWPAPDRTPTSSYRSRTPGVRDRITSVSEKAAPERFQLLAASFGVIRCIIASLSAGRPSCT